LHPLKNNQTIQTWNFDSNQSAFYNIGNLIYNSQIHSSFNWANDILIFTDSQSQNSIFYDYNLRSVQKSFNLPPQSVYSIIKALNGGLLLAVGDDINHFTSLEYFQV